MKLALALLLAGCAPGTWAWQRPAVADDRDPEAWAAVRAEAEREWGDLERCSEPWVRWTETHAEASRECSAPPETTWGCVRAPNHRTPYIVAWRRHPYPRRLVLTEMVRWAMDCAGLPPDYRYEMQGAWGPGGVLERAWARLR